jgi:acyl dehydratase
MSFDPAVLLSLPPLITRQSYSAKDVILYAFGVGVGQDDATDPDALAFLYEKALSVLPTMAIVIAAPPFWLDAPELEIDWRRVLNAGQELVLHRPLPVEANMSTELRIDAIWDKGADKGALMQSSRTLRDEAGIHYATIHQTHILRGNGGFGGRDMPKADAKGIPDRAPDAVVDLTTRQEQALIYRLCGDLNPLHIEPEVATAAGFPKPILHGSCTFGIVGRAVLQAAAGNQPDRLGSFGARFSRPVLPGDTIRSEIWMEGADDVRFRAKALERDVVVLDAGTARIAT